MREIKFKCWIAKTKKMVVLESATENHNHYLQMGSGGFWLYASVDGALMANSEVGDILLQFIGLPDKNGNEIYDGDILSIPELYETPEMTKQRFINWGVTFIHGAWHLQRPGRIPELDESSLFQEFEANDGNFEIIGNIYEHPDLLK